MSSNFIVNVPRLKGRENYSDWAFAIENFLVLEGLSECVNVVDETNDAKARAKIILTIDTSLYVHIKESVTTVELWKKLKSMFDDSGFARRITLLRNLISTRLENCNSMALYVNQIVELGQKLKNTGFDISDTWIGSLLLAGLPEKYSPMIMAIEHSGIQISTDAIRTKLLDLEVDFAKSGSGNSSSGAFASCVGYKNSVGRSMSSQMSSVRKDFKNIRCFRCKQLGHFRNKCPVVTKNDDTKQSKFNAFSAVFLSQSFDKTEWYIDSGASVHLTANSNWINNSVKPDMKDIIVADHRRLQVKCEGDVDLKTVVGKEIIDVVVNNVLCVPELTTNLLSVSQMIKNKNKVVFDAEGCRIFNVKGTLIGTADLVNGVYKLNVETVRCFAVNSSKEVDSEVWHRRLGHLNSTYLNKMKNGVVRGLSFHDVAKIEKKNCVVCCEGKQSRLPFSNTGTRAEQVLDVVHADVCGPMEKKSIGGSRYFLIFEDDFSRMVFVYFLKKKEETYECFKNFKNLVENQTGKSIKALRSDNGGEFCSNQLENFLASNGIIHQKTNPYTPEQNGMSERMNRTVVEKAKCMLFDANLDKKFWAEAVNTAVYLRNRSLVSGLEKTPFEMWTGSKPDVSHLRIFGSTVMVHVPKEKRLKWDKKAIRHVLVGYSENKGYRVYNPKTGVVSTSRDCTIMENRNENEITSIDDVKISVSVGDTDLQPSGTAIVDTDQSICVLPVENVNVNVEKQTTAIEESMNMNEINVDEVNGVEKEEENTWFDANSPSAGDSSENIPENESNVRRSKRTWKPRIFSDHYTYFCASEDSYLDSDPGSVESAMARADADKWKSAMDEELRSFERNQAWELVDIPEGGTVVQCKWVFKRKCDSEGEVKYRARLVAKGFTQKSGIDYNETFSPVVRHSTLRLLIALSVEFNFKITHLDVTTAFLNGILKENVFMTIPDGLKVNKANQVLKLKRAIYGLKQSSRTWYERVDDVLVNLKYKKSKYEPCLYMKCNDTGMTVIALYVDDFFIFSNDLNETNFVKRELNSNFDIKDLGQIKNCLGMRVNICEQNKTITLDQAHFVDEILKKFNMLSCNGVATPMENNLNLIKQNIKSCNFPYQELIGSLMYLAILTRPDIAHAVSFLSQFNNCFDETHCKHAKRILRYLQNTRNYGLLYCKGEADLEGFVDADWASNCVDRKSYTGFCFKLSNSAISWESKKQATVALSSTEAEYMAISEAAKEAIYLKNLYFELTGRNTCIKLYNDNLSAQKLSVNPVFHKRSKHIDVRHHFIRDAIVAKQVELQYLQSKEMPADVLTKGLGSEKHYKCINDLGVVDLRKMFVQ